MQVIRSFVLMVMVGFSGWLCAEPVNINIASAMELAEALNGIGESRAAAIVAFREKNGPFLSADQLLQVKGIGERILDKNRDDIMIKSANE